MVWSVALMSVLSGGQALAAENPADAQQSVRPVSPPFPDVPRNHWAFEAVERVRKAGIMIGYPDGTFGGPAARNPEAAGSLAQRASSTPASTRRAPNLARLADFRGTTGRAVRCSVWWTW